MARNPESTDAFGAAIVPRLRGVRNRGQTSKGMTLAELLALPLIVDITTAARALGLSRSTGYELARRGEFRAACCMSVAPTVFRPLNCCASLESASANYRRVFLLRSDYP